MNKDLLMQLKRVTKTYLMGEVKVEALKESSLDIYQGEILVILGPSGSGKSTLLNLIGGMDKPSSGDIIFKDRSLSKASDRELTQFRRHEIGFVFQFYNLISDLTAGENVALAAGLVNNPLPTQGVLAQVGLEARQYHFPSQLSGGEQQRVSIARAMVKNPTLLLCDEPTGALDYHTGITILQLLKQTREAMGSTIIIVTHNTAIGAMADRLVRMRSGSIAEIIVNDSPLPPERIEW
ncbi:MAG: ABC transporter ATP-binding protein [Syntrophomonadaceae bacterium]|jgi:putative ABC transport system ATP-binding protein|nr:ABC transporter ATP-binding protein [Syntrophomonadaceae bacterium]